MSIKLFAPLLLAISASCASSMHSSNQIQTGFLSDYSRLEDSSDSDKARSWAAPGFRLEDYSGFYVPLVEIWMSEEHREQISYDSLMMLSKLYRDQTIEKLKANGWNIVEQPDPGTATLRLALTELHSPNTIGSIVSSIPYATTLLFKLTATAADAHIFVGQASTEVQIRDNSTDAVVVEALDRRVGSHGLLNMGSTWADVKDILDVWSTRLADGLSNVDAQ